ncbi:SWIB/MDM2 domain-containing protein [uncultured Xylophilus sp.]|uniref:SWIB/MDM2 domain-containing protein n=1 Tax=uncultured Xylophilus sp. TaxID=296832 RepID=UPI0025D6BAD1|nr:SWIB/MDM2 domain-containing protein [uncultured Xylophilus sp.]
MATAKKAPAKAPAKAASDKAAAKKAPAAKRTPNPAFMKALTPSPALAAVVGSTPLPRTEIVSKLWTYIKQHDLQDKANKRNINADAKLKAIFDKDQVSMFELAALIGKHVS